MFGDFERSRVDIPTRDQSPPLRRTDLIYTPPEWENYMERSQKVFFSKNPAPKRSRDEDYEVYRHRLAAWFLSLPEDERTRRAEGYPRMTRSESANIASFLNFAVSDTGKQQFHDTYGTQFDAYLDKLDQDDIDFNLDSQYLLEQLGEENDRRVQERPTSIFKKVKTRDF